MYDNYKLVILTCDSEKHDSNFFPTTKILFLKYSHTVNSSFRRLGEKYCSTNITHLLLLLCFFNFARRSNNVVTEKKEDFLSAILYRQ